MNGTTTTPSHPPLVPGPRLAKPPPTGPAPPVPAVAPPAPNHTHPPATARPNPAPHNHHTTVNGTHPQTQKGKKKPEAPVDPAQMYESLKSRIAALEEEEVLEEEEEKRFGTQSSVVETRNSQLTSYIAEEAQKSVKGMEENAIHAKYIELVSI